MVFVEVEGVCVVGAEIFLQGRRIHSGIVASWPRRRHRHSLWLARVDLCPRLKLAAAYPLLCDNEY